MDRKGTGRKDRAALRRIIALLLAMAGLAEAACGRSRPVRWLVLLILGSAELIARDHVAGLTGVPEFTPTEILIDPDAVDASIGDASIGDASIGDASIGDASIGDDSISKAMRLAFVFRALAASLSAILAGLPDEAAAPAAQHAAGLLAALRDLLPAPFAERLDSS